MYSIPRIHKSKEHYVGMISGSLACCFDLPENAFRGQGGEIQDIVRDCHADPRGGVCSGEDPIRQVLDWEIVIGRDV